MPVAQVPLNQSDSDFLYLLIWYIYGLRFRRVSLFCATDSLPYIDFEIRAASFLQSLKCGLYSHSFTTVDASSLQVVPTFSTAIVMSKQMVMTPQDLSLTVMVA